MIERDDVVAAVASELAPTGRSPEEVAAMAEGIADRLRLGLPGPSVPRKPFYDLRREQDFVYRNGKRKVRKLAGVPVRRDVRRVVGVVLHQTACEYGLSNKLIDAAGGDEELALARRGLNVGCHAIAFRRGFFVATHDLDLHVNHGNRFNATTLGLEIEGHYPGLADDPKTVAREDLRVTRGEELPGPDERTIETARVALRWLVETGRSMGMPIRFLYAHRQSSPTRRADPGEALWKGIAPWARETLGLELAPRRVFSTSKGAGRPIPKAWDPAGFGGY
ncbi:MAG: N-acetylmuramoyl-L-alanine amidase [Sandaracinaceae bacterium]|nr:MAG: N-acetylmuramoyl-L-alanine amidase [Sandaracinaceae bacterium]